MPTRREVSGRAGIGCRKVSGDGRRTRRRAVKKEQHVNLSCSFCGKSQREVRKLIAGPTVYICDECIKLCNEIIAEESDREDGKPQVSLPTPMEIKAFLDDYVVGQACVAVINASVASGLTLAMGHAWLAVVQKAAGGQVPSINGVFDPAVLRQVFEEEFAKRVPRIRKK